MSENWTYNGDLSGVKTSDLEKELEKRKNKLTVYKIVSIDRVDDATRLLPKKWLHIIEDEDGNQVSVDIVNSVGDSFIHSKEPCMSDGEPGYDDAWEEFEDFKANYIIGKKVRITAFKPYIEAELL